jgi:hypothetical protein
MTLTTEETKVTLAFLERVNLNGKEADAMVHVKNKLRAGLEEKPEEPKEDTKETCEQSQ